MFYKVFYTNWFIPKGFIGITLGPFIFIRPSRKDDVGLLEHEKVHVKQFYQSFGLFWFFYLLSKDTRLNYEVEAYREQLKYSPGREETFANIIATKYKLDVSKEEALKLLTNK